MTRWQMNRMYKEKGGHMTESWRGWLRSGSSVGLGADRPPLCRPWRPPERKKLLLHKTEKNSLATVTILVAFYILIPYYIELYYEAL